MVVAHIHFVYSQTKPTPKYTNAVLGRLLRASAYGNFVREYPASISKLQTSISKDIETYNTVWVSFDVFSCVLNLINYVFVSTGEEHGSDKPSYSTCATMADQETDIDVRHPWIGRYRERDRKFKRG